MSDVDLLHQPVESDPWAVQPEYKSTAFRASLHPYYRDSDRDGLGRFLPRWSPDGLCDRVGCDQRRVGRFCPEHRREHGERLGAQFRAVVADHHARIDRAAVGVIPETGKDKP